MRSFIIFAIQYFWLCGRGVRQSSAKACTAVRIRSEPLKNPAGNWQDFSIFMSMEKIILASNSPRRRQLLEMAEISFEVMVAQTDESYPENLPLENIPEHIALQKALAIKEKINNATILAADTIVAINNKIIGKPADRTDAIEILKELSGNTHVVISGVAILSGEKKIVFNEVTEVTFYKLTEARIIHYIDRYKPYDKAGAYAIQEWIGAIGIKAIHGDYYNVVGLPISKVVQTLDFLQNKSLPL